MANPLTVLLEHVFKPRSRHRNRLFVHLHLQGARFRGANPAPHIENLREVPSGSVRRIIIAGKNRRILEDFEPTMTNELRIQIAAMTGIDMITQDEEIEAVTETDPLSVGTTDTGEVPADPNPEVGLPLIDQVIVTGGLDRTIAEEKPREARVMLSAVGRVVYNERARACTLENNNQTLQRDTFKHGQSNAADKASDRDIPMDDADASTAPANPQSLDEAAIIEARRKRREAIKAKYKGQEPSMLVQALEIKSAAQNLLNLDEKSPTPLIVAENDTPKPASVTTSPPQTPRDMMGQDSPTDIIHGDNDLANDEEHQVPAEAGDGPSAVDYDPTMDMQEDRLRQTHRLNGNDVSSSAYDETVPQKQDVLLPEKPHADTQAPKDEFDMFADAEDMFAELPPPTKLHYDEGDMARAAHIPRGKALDMSMLDDWDDDEGYYKVILGELLDGRYHVQSNLGRGMFSGVVRALDQVNQKQVAIKLIRSNETMKKAGLKEIEILVKLAQADPEDKKHLIRLERYFEHKGHLCMVFENLSINLREVLKKFGRDVGINLKAVRAYAQQMFLGLSLMRKCSILHADLKPDNVLVNESRNMLKICDLGSASDASENEITPYLVSRFYRAPEIMLGMPYDFAIDVWSIGCTLYELYTGKILFTGRNNNQMLRSIMECRGKFNHKLLRKAQFAPIHFDDLLNFRSVERDRLSGKDIVRILPFTKPTRDLRTRLGVNRNQLDEAESKELASFLDLLERCLNLNPEKRCTATEALRHPFILRKF
ncbi:U4/U6 small nuclear ribonucleoprotein prp4 [Agyrium rufum]|nr:U4/U6 small nuclear ribonucleoprotein prp4 [Agyrium rufum]